MAELGLLDRLDATGIRTYELFYTNRFGQEIWRELRGTDAGYEVPQFSIHRGRLQAVIYQAVRARLGESRIHTGHRLGHLSQDEAGVSAYFFDRNGSHRATARGDVLIGADGIHSVVREALYPNEGSTRWNGAMLWRGAVEWPAFLTGRSMVIAGGMAAKLVVYPIAEGARPDRRLTNWALVARTRHAARRRRPSDVSGRLQWRLASDPRCPLPRRSPAQRRACAACALAVRAGTAADDGADRAHEPQRRPGKRDRRGRRARARRVRPHRRRAVVRRASGHCARLCLHRGLRTLTGQQGGVGATRSKCPLPATRGEGAHRASALVGFQHDDSDYPGGGRNTTSCLAASATTSSGFCSFMLWIAQNRS